MGAMYICICLTSFSWKMNALMLLKLQHWSLAIYGQVNLWGYCLNFCSEFLLNPIPAKQWEENLNTREVAKYCLLYTEISMCMHIRSADLQVETILISDQVHCQTKVSISTRTTNLQKCIYWGTFKLWNTYSLLEKDEITKYPVQVCLRGLGKVKVNDHINSLDVNSSGKQICNKEQTP